VVVEGVLDLMLQEHKVMAELAELVEVEQVEMLHCHNVM
tara:strand:+ start:1246 stop:1362 length:117 start_codon:yes stop_codon:yes gene_type:complete